MVKKLGYEDHRKYGTPPESAEPSLQNVLKFCTYAQGNMVQLSINLRSYWMHMYVFVQAFFKIGYFWSFMPNFKYL